MSEDSISPEVERAGALGDAKAIADAGLLTEREAQAWVLLEVYDWSAGRAAEAMQVSKSRVYNARKQAQDDIQSARRTLNLLDRLSDDETLSPRFCAECGDALSNWTVADGQVVCPSCAEADG
jgi:predicted DNA-binding protein YlxM (UPF0122 family)